LKIDSARRLLQRRLAVRLLGLLAVLVAMLMLVPPPAAALPGPASFTTGLVDDPLFAFSSGPLRSLWLARARALGSTSVRIEVFWNRVAPEWLLPGFRPSNPADPRYNWSAVDAAVRAAAAHQQVVVLLLKTAPPWAEGPNRPRKANPGTWLPNPTAYAAFARAAAVRYSGRFRDQLHHGRTLPRVRYFQAWNEVNLPRYLMPQWAAGPGGSLVPVSPVIYRAMLNAFYGAVKSAVPDDVVLAGGTSPYGDAPGTGQNRMYPMLFYRELFCLTQALHPKACPGGPPEFDVLDHHPYGLTPINHAHTADNVSLADIGKIWRVLHAAERFGLAQPAGPKSLWVTELDWTSIPPDSPAIQARYLALGFYELWLQGVSHVFWFSLRDPVGDPNSFSASGLYRGDGSAKPAAAAFRFPFVALRDAGLLTVWGLAPAAGTVEIEARTGYGWQPMFWVQTTAGRVFYAQRGIGARLQLRAVIGGIASPVYDTG
jgi:hypothetical protein